MLKRLTQLDYDRNMAFVALDTGTGALAGISRLSSDPDHAVAEYALMVRTDLQGHGLGWELLSQIIDYAKADGIGRIKALCSAKTPRCGNVPRIRLFSNGIIERPGLVEAKLELR
jgi:acetyltransferase